MKGQREKKTGKYNFSSNNFSYTCILRMLFFNKFNSFPLDPSYKKCLKNITVERPSILLSKMTTEHTNSCRCIFNKFEREN